MTPRSCGPCTACCTSLAIKDDHLKKAAATPCPHLCADGCSIYTTRPTSCAAFRCAWLDGFGDDSDRPDLSGAIVELGNLGDPQPGELLADALQRRICGVTCSPGFDVDSPGPRRIASALLESGFPFVALRDAARLLAMTPHATRAWNIFHQDAEGLTLRESPTP